MKNTTKQAKTVEETPEEAEDYREYYITNSTFVFEKGSKPKFLVGKPSPPPKPPGGS